MSKPIPLSLSPAQRAVDWTEAECCSDRFVGSWLWDAELDGGGEKNAKGESAAARALRHTAAKLVCGVCTQREACNAAGRSDPYAEGIYGGELIVRTQEGSKRGLREGLGGPRLPVGGDDLRDQEDALAHRG